MKTPIITLALILATALSAFAYNITGTVIDSEGEPMIRATVRVLNAKDSTAVKGDLTDDMGRFKISEIKKGKYLLETSYVGFNTLRQPIEVKGNLNVGNLLIRENAEMLRDVTVTGIKTPIKVMEDTIEFNADSYKTQPNAVVEDLLKRLPGVEVASDGKITANGKTVSKILVDGKEFFSDDPQVASKTLPVDMVDKLQVVDRKSDLARMTGVDDGEEETVINLTVKKGMKNGVFGTVEAGYGTDKRYAGSFNINKFFNDNQITFLGNANNINRMGFTDGGSGFSRFGGGNGIKDTQSLGLNFSIGNEEIFRVGGDVMYMHTDQDTWSRQNRQYLFPDSSSYYDSEKDANDRGHSIRSNFRMLWKPDSLNTFEFRPNFNANFNDSRSTEASNTYAGRQDGTVGDQVNKSYNSQMSHGKSYNFSGRLIYNHNSAIRKGRSLSFFVNYSLSDTHEKENTYSWNRFYSALMADDPYDIYDQYADNHTWNNQLSSRFSWTEPIGDVKKGNFIVASYQFSYRWNNADKIVYDRYVEPTDDPLLGLAHDLNLLPTDTPIDSLSNRFRNDYMNQEIRLGFRHVDKKNNLNVGITFVPQMSKSKDLINSSKSIPERNVLNYAPFIRYRFKASKSRSLNLNYNGRSSQPTMSQLQPVADYSDPLNVIQGNPNLNPSFSHNLRFRFQDFNQDAQRSIMLMLYASMTQNSIISKTEFNSATGGRFTTYENVNGIWNAGGFTMVSFPFRNKSFRFNNHLSSSFSHQVGYNSVGNGQFQRNNSGSLRIMEGFGIAFRPDNLELELRPNYSLQYTSNSVQKSANTTVHSFGGTFNGTYYTPFGLVLGTDLTYTANTGYSQGYNKNEWMWNAQISYMTLKDKSLTISLRASDILQQRSSVNRTVTASYIQDAINNTLTRYVMLSLTYKFNSFGKGNEPQVEQRPGGHRHGDGPPPGGGPGGPGRRPF